MVSRIHSTLLTMTAALLLFPANYLHAADQQPDASAPPPPSTPVPAVEVKGSEALSWDSNPLMLPNGAKALFGSITSPELILNSKTPISSFRSDTLINENIFDQSAFNSTDLHENLSLSRQMQQWGAGITGKVDYDTTRTSEITTYGLNLPYVRHTGLTASPDISYSPTSTDKIILAGSANKTTYNNNAFVDYEVFSLNPSYEHNFDPMNKGIFTLNAQRYQTTGGNQIKVDSIGPTVGWMTLLTPRFSIRVDGGVQKAMQNSTLATSGSSSWDYIFDADLSFKGQQDKTDFIASRSQYPFGNGTETLLTSFSVTESHALNPRLSINANGNYQFAKAPSGVNIVNLDREFGAGTGLTYHLFRNLDATASYQYRNEVLNGLPGTINDHAILVGITYHPFSDTK